MNGKKHMQVQRDQDTPSALHLAPNAKPVQVIQREPVAGQAYQRVLGGPRSFSPADLRSLQLTIGNQAVQRLLTGQRRTEATPLQRISEPTQNQGNTTSLPDTLKTGIETLSGLSMDDVQVHYNSSRPAEVQALAYTQGTDIHIGPDQKQHLPHEGWHVVQQKLGRVKPTLQASGVAINDDQELEKEADVMGARAGSMGRRALQDARSDPGSQLIAQGLPYVAQQNEGLMQRHGGQSVPHLIPDTQTTPHSNITTTPTAVIQRKAAKEMLENLKDISGDRWHDDMQDMIDEIVLNYGDVEIGDFNIGVPFGGAGKKLISPPPDQMFFQFAFAVAMATKDPQFSASRYGKLVQYLLTGAGTPPGAGSLGKVRIVGSEIIERPGFASKTLAEVAIKPGQARRHITAWHNIRAFINKLIKDKPQVLNDAIDSAFKDKIIDSYISEEAEELLAKKPKATFGDLDAAFGKKVIKAAFLMNSRIRNLWSGQGKENSEIATFSSNLQTYITAFKVHGDVDRLKDDISKYKTNSKLAQQVQGEMIEEIEKYPNYPGTPYQNAQILVNSLKGRLFKLEVDAPQGTHPEGGALGKTEQQIHEAMFQILFLGVTFDGDNLRMMIRYFMSGSTGPV